VSSDTVEDLHCEYHILRKHCSHPNLPDLYGVYLKKAESGSEHDKLWFVMEVRLANRRPKPCLTIINQRVVRKLGTLAILRLLHHVTA
jgi:hypothetical protein